jgi:hypothetical protein
MDAKTATLVKHLVDVAVERPDYDHLVIKIMQRLLDDMGSGEIHRPWVRVGQETSKLEAVKMYRDHWNCSLIEAKKSVEKYFADHGLEFAKVNFEGVS